MLRDIINMFLFMEQFKRQQREELNRTNIQKAVRKNETSFVYVPCTETKRSTKSILKELKENNYEKN